MISIFTTMTNPIKRQDLIQEAIDCYRNLADEVVVINSGTSVTLKGEPFYHRVDVMSKWPKEFEWSLIGQQFQRGYEVCTKEWVLHCDLDFIFHDKDYQTIRDRLENSNAPAMSFWKWQFIQPDRYNLKSRLVIAVNKGRYGDRIRFDGGGESDLCQPSLDGKLIRPDDVPEIGIAIWNYDCLLKSKEQLLEDKGRFARAWQRTFGTYKLGGPDDQSAYDEWLKMVLGRNKKAGNSIPLEDHPKVMHETLRNLKPENWGYNGFGNFEAINYASR